MAANLIPDDEVCRLLRIAASDNSRIVSVVDDILDHLTDLGFVYRVRVLPAMMGVHPRNRDALGINEADCHKLGADICALGWSSNACRDAIAIEESEWPYRGIYCQDLQRNKSPCSCPARHDQIRLIELWAHEPVSASGDLFMFFCILLDGFLSFLRRYSLAPSATTLVCRSTADLMLPR